MSLLWFIIVVCCVFVSLYYCCLNSMYCCQHYMVDVIIVCFDCSQYSMLYDSDCMLYPCVLVFLLYDRQLVCCMIPATSFPLRIEIFYL